MYIWCAIDLDGQLSELREQAKAVSVELGAENHALTLPLHISLKISCEIDDGDFAVAAEKISEYLSLRRPFEITPVGIEKEGCVVWIRHRESDGLREMHEWLVELFKNQYGVQPHEFDLDFAYHTSLFVGEEKDAIAVYKMLKNATLPEKFTAESYVIGASVSGKAGEYRVVKSVEFGIRD